MRGIKLLVLAIVLAILGTIAYVGIVTRQSADAGVSPAQGRATALEREMEETGRIVNGRRR
jgi:uncharacterized protein (UPF0333 family)